MKFVEKTDFEKQPHNLNREEVKRIKRHIPRARLPKWAERDLVRQEKAIARFIIKSALKQSLDEDKYYQVILGPFIKYQYEQLWEWRDGKWGPVRGAYSEDNSFNAAVARCVQRGNLTRHTIERYFNNMAEYEATGYGDFAYKVTHKDDMQGGDGEGGGNSEDKSEKQSDAMQALMEEQQTELQKLLEEIPDLDLPDDIKEQIQQAMGETGESATGQSSQQQQDQRNETELEYLLRKLKECILYLDKGEGPHDVISTATFKNAGRMYNVGIPAKGILHAMALHWPQSVKDNLELEDYDPATFGTPRPGEHKLTPYVEALINARIPVLLVGPTQAGKGYISKAIAKARELPFGSTPLSAGTSLAWLFGRNMPHEFVGTDFLKCYENGGVYLADEMDAADPNLLIAINDSISNGELSNPVKDERIEKHDDFILIAAANTLGLGADADYTGRERLDMATLERFRMGRVMIDYDRELQEQILLSEAGPDREANDKDEDSDAE